MYSVVLQIDEEDQDPIIARMWERGTGGIVQKQDTLEAFFWDNCSAPLCCTNSPSGNPKS